MNWSDFSIGFWHPFGSHASEHRDSILTRKAREIQDNGWTLWSFQHRKTLDLWRNLIQTHNPSRVYVLCSDSPGALDPRSQVGFCRSFRLPGKEWDMIPQSISVPHPFGSNVYASAFRVKNIMKSSSMHDPPSFTIEWYSTQDANWRRDMLPTRGEYLIRRGSGGKIRRVYAILELECPYIAYLRR